MSFTYEGILDEVHELTQKYAVDHIMLWTGDINASPDRTQPTSNDRRFKRFCNTEGYCITRHSPRRPQMHRPTLTSQARAPLDWIISFS